MLGVLREVLAADGEPHPGTSRLFTSELRTDPRSDAPNWRFLPSPSRRTKRECSSGILRAKR